MLRGYFLLFCVLLRMAKDRFSCTLLSCSLMVLGIKKEGKAHRDIKGKENGAGTFSVILFNPHGHVICAKVVGVEQKGGG